MDVSMDKVWRRLRTGAWFRCQKRECPVQSLIAINDRILKRMDSRTGWKSGLQPRSERDA